MINNCLGYILTLFFFFFYSGNGFKGEEMEVSVRGNKTLIPIKDWHKGTSLAEEMERHHGWMSEYRRLEWQRFMSWFPPSVSDRKAFRRGMKWQGDGQWHWGEGGYKWFLCWMSAVMRAVVVVVVARWRIWDGVGFKVLWYTSRHLLMFSSHTCTVWGNHNII